MGEQTYDPKSELSEPKDALQPVSLEELPEIMREAVKRAEWTELTPVQARAIPYLQARRDHDRQQQVQDCGRRYQEHRDTWGAEPQQVLTQVIMPRICVIHDRFRLSGCGSTSPRA